MEKKKSSYLSAQKRNLKIRIVFYFLLIIFGFLFVFIPVEYFGIPKGATIFELSVKFASSSVLSPLIVWLLFATDPLATGKSKYSEFFRSYYPSVLVMRKYPGIKQGEATQLWLSFFNKWSDPECEHNSTWRTVLERTYSCRFIFYFLFLLSYSLIFSTLAMVIYGAYNYWSELPILNFNHVLYTAIIFCIWLFLRKNNQIPSKKGTEPSGCWYKYKEISEMEMAIFEDKILSKSPTYQDALKAEQDFKC